ncbi:MAG TPA: 30S ribosomal protein S8 [Anaerolineae bacterium]|nr:30S ribosomal protein S8 [Anaerolineae bacterium]
MSISDPIGDMLTRVRNATMVGHSVVAMPSSRMKLAIAHILKEEGFIQDFEAALEQGHVQPTLRVWLKYVGDRRERVSAITGVERISRPGCRIYTHKEDVPWVLSGMGIAILSTPKGVITGQQARRLGVGGEVLCKVW